MRPAAPGARPAGRAVRAAAAAAAALPSAAAGADAAIGLIIIVGRLRRLLVLVPLLRLGARRTAARARLQGTKAATTTATKHTRRVSARGMEDGACMLSLHAALRSPALLFFSGRLRGGRRRLRAAERTLAFGVAFASAPSPLCARAASEPGLELACAALLFPAAEACACLGICSPARGDAGGTGGRDTVRGDAQGASGRAGPSGRSSRARARSSAALHTQSERERESSLRSLFAASQAFCGGRRPKWKALRVWPRSVCGQPCATVQR